MLWWNGVIILSWEASPLEYFFGMKMIYLQFNQSKYLLSSANGLKPAFATLSLPSQTFNVTIKLPGGGGGKEAAWTSEKVCLFFVHRDLAG